MPMDYDDNETSHHNLQLAGESRSRSPSTLRPYDFPKFDFDDSLQGHLRFDSLVETEVFLGIQSQEDNQWIEDFSRVSNGMEFNSTPTDSCSISRRNNVWSEATSSESVEMLLKSVGQEETNTGALTLPESNVTPDQGTLIKVVESSSNNIKLKDGNDVNSDSTLPSNEVLNEQLENPLASHSKDESAVVNSCDFSQNVESKEVLEEFKTSIEGTLGEKDSSSIPSITHTVDSDIGMLSTSEASQQVDFSDGKEKHASFGLIPESSRDSQEANLDPGRESLENSVKGDFVLSSFEGDDTNKSFTTSTHTVIPISSETDKIIDKCEGESSMDGNSHHSVELHGISSGDRTNPEQMLDPTLELPLKQDNDNKEDVSTSPLKCVGISESSLVLMEVNETLTTDEVKHAGISLATEEESGAHLLPDDVNVAMQVVQENLDHSRTDILERKDTCKGTVGDKEVPGDIENVDSKNIGTKDDKNQFEVSGLVGDTSIHNLQPQTSDKQESADYPEVGQSKSDAIGLLQPDNEREKVGMSEANLDVEVDNTSKVEVSMANNTVGTPICEISTLDQQRVEKIEDISSNVPSSMTKENVDSVIGGVTMTKEEEKESGQTTDDKTSCGSPTIISSSEPSQIVNDIQEECKGFQVANEVGGIQSTSENSKRIELSGDDSGFTFKVNALPDTINTEPPKNWSLFPDVEKAKVLVESAPTSKGKTGRMSSPKTPRKNAKVLEGETGPSTLKGTSERKGRRGSAKGTPKESVKKGNQLKGQTQENSSLKVEKVSSNLSSPLYSPHVKVGQIQQQYGNVEATNKKPSDIVAQPNLPDLNSSSSSLPSFRQPFSDLQQVQLRAQIFVYGSLIQGNVPDETCMVSAFGQYEGGRAFWERTWRAASERVQSQKSTTAIETPRSQSGARGSDTVKQGSQSSKLPATAPMSKTNSKETHASTLSPMIPLSSPLWNISTPSQNSLTSNPLHKGHGMEFQHALTPVQSYQAPQIRPFVGHTSWPLQTGFPSPWLASPQTASFNSTPQFRPVTMTETVKLTPVKDTSSPLLTSTGKLTTSSPPVHVVSPSPALGGLSSPLHSTKSIPSASQDPKPRKRKKAPIFDPTQATSLSESQQGAMVVSNVASLPTTPIRATIPPPPTSIAILTPPTTNTLTLPSIELPKKPDLDIEKRVTSSDEMSSKVAEAKNQAEDASTLANAAISHCEDLWGQLAKRKELGLTSESEAKSASFAAAIAAAVSVAKAAAAAAKIAYNAALQAKLMADEAVKNSGVGPSNEKSSPSSISRSNSVIDQSSSILVAAKEAAKRRVEAASVAARQAENLDAIVKAAELAASAVSQAEKIVTMGEPLSLDDLIEAGPDGFWKLPQSSLVVAEKVRGRNLVQLGEGDVRVTEGLDGSKHTDEKDLRNGVDLETSHMSKSSKAAPEIDPLRTSNVKNDNADLAGKVVDGIMEGSYVEVFNPKSVQKPAWYTANVLNVEEGKAYVLYNDILSEEGSGNVKEWVPIESEGDKAPIIRIAHALQHQKTRKRRRAALADYGWCVGDKVDVWIDDCWWEGVVTEKSDKDETTLKVHISAQGETSTVRAWNLRASRSWINGKWIESSSSKVQNASEQSDTPQEKRQKFGSPISLKSKDKESNKLDSTIGTTEQSKSLNLSTSETTFDIGKTTTNDNKLGPRRQLRTNQQKEGSRVVFGVPKPTGKKRKFMEVSKHFSTNKTEKSTEPNDSVKFAKYLMPQGGPSRGGWKLPTRSDTKEKRIVESKPRIVNTRKAQRTLPQRENSRSKSGQDTDTSTDQGNELEDSVNRDENSSDKSMEGEAPLSSLLPHSQSMSSKKVSSSNSKSDRPNRGRMGTSSAKLSKIEEDKVYTANTGKSTVDVSEPRRSNRRIQPTHRLLEGLQSSMAIPKMPAVSHDKSRRNMPPRGK